MSYRRFVTSLWNNASLQLDKQTTKNKQLMPFEQRVNPRPFFKKKKFVFWSKTFPTNDSLTPKRSNVQDNNDVTKQSLCSISSFKLNGHFGNVFVKPSAVFLLLTLSSLSRLRKKKICIGFFWNVLLTFRRLKSAEKRCLNFGKFDL